MGLSNNKPSAGALGILIRGYSNVSAMSEMGVSVRVISIAMANKSKYKAFGTLRIITYKSFYGFDVK